LKQLSRDPNAAEKARRAERKADAEAGLRVIETPGEGAAPAPAATSGGGFKKGGFKSSFAAVKGSTVPAAPVKRNILGDDEDDTPKPIDSLPPAASKVVENEERREDVESDSDEGYSHGGDAYYDPRQPTDCFAGCAAQNIKLAT
jgi:hypothetical protein